MPCPPRAAALAVLALGGCATTVYYPAPVPPIEGWEPACASVVDAAVAVENTLDVAAEVQELLPDEACAPVFRGVVEPGGVVDFGVAIGSVWRAYDADSGDWLGTFVVAAGDNLLVLE